jgi:formamidase
MAVKRPLFFRPSDPWWLALTTQGSRFAGRSSGRDLDLLIVAPAPKALPIVVPTRLGSRFCRGRSE